MPKKVKANSTWKEAEKKFAATLRKHGIAATRVIRDRYESDYDVHIDNFESLKIDSKYTRSSPFRSHGLLREIEAKYCLKKGDIPVLVTRNYKEHGAMVMVKDEFFAELLACWLDRKGLLVKDYEKEQESESGVDQSDSSHHEDIQHPRGVKSGKGEGISPPIQERKQKRRTRTDQTQLQTDN